MALKDHVAHKKCRLSERMNGITSSNSHGWIVVLNSLDSKRLQNRILTEFTSIGKMENHGWANNLNGTKIYLKPTPYEKAWESFLEWSVQVGSVCCFNEIVHDDGSRFCSTPRGTVGSWCEEVTCWAALGSSSDKEVLSTYAQALLQTF